MNALLVALIVAAIAPPGAAAAQDDLRCYRLMAELARAHDPAVRLLGLSAASYFLGRIDAASPGYDVAGIPAVADEERPALIRRCGEALDSNGFDLRAVGRSLEGPQPTV